MPKWSKFVFVVSSVFATSTFAQSSPYIVDGLALGSQVVFQSEAYRQYQCTPSDYPDLTWCHKAKTEKTGRGEIKSSNTILHKQDGTAVYVNHYIEPAFFGPNEIPKRNRPAVSEIR
jgi:hypothetical protein